LSSERGEAYSATRFIFVVFAKHLSWNVCRSDLFLQSLLVPSGKLTDNFSGNCM
jgi:hypothetical protein